MIKLTVKKETTALGTTGDMVTIVVAAGALERLISITMPDPPRPGTPPEGWRVYVGQQNCEAVGASLLHALELGIAAAARWIAVELLKDPYSPAAGDERVYGAGLILAHRDDYWRLQLARDLQRDYLGNLYQDSRQWNCAELRDMVPERAVRATREQALAVLIEHAAPWIAAALAKEVES